MQTHSFIIPQSSSNYTHRLQGVRERLRLLQGRLAVESRPSAGAKALRSCASPTARRTSTAHSTDRRTKKRRRSRLGSLRSSGFGSRSLRIEGRYSSVRGTSIATRKPNHSPLQAPPADERAVDDLPHTRARPPHSPRTVRLFLVKQRLVESPNRDVLIRADTDDDVIVEMDAR